MFDTSNTKLFALFGFWRNLKLRTKLIAVLLAVSLIPLLVITYINDTNTRATLLQEANARLLSAASLVAVKIDNFMLDNLNTLRAEAQAPAVVDYLTLPASERAGSPEAQRLNSFLLAIARQNPVYMNSVAVVDRNGITLLDTQPSAIGLDRSSRYWFQETISSGLPYASTVEYDSITGRASLYFSAPVRNRDGEVVGMIRKRFDAAILQSFTSSETGLAGQASFAVVLDENFVRIAHGANRKIIYKSIVPFTTDRLAQLQSQRFMPPGTPNELSTNLPDFQAAIENYKSAPFFAAELTLGGGGDLEQVAIIETKTQPWVVAFAQPQNIFLAPIEAQARANLLIALGIGVLVVLFGVVVSQTIAGPIARLTKVAEKIAAGDINIAANVETGDEIGTLAETFNRMTAQLRDFIANLEVRVAARTRALATTAEVSRRLTTILDSRELSIEVVTEAQKAFDYYHAHIYLMDSNGENLVMAGGTGDAGAAMLASGHKIPKGRGLVGRAANTNEPVLVPDVSQSIGWLPNPLLPDTKAEVAVPISIGDQVLGVLDVQHNVVYGLGEDDVTLLQSLAGQVAISLQNARAYERSRAQAEMESLANFIGQRIQRAASVDEVLQTAARELGMAIGATRVSANIGTSRQHNDGNETSLN